MNKRGGGGGSNISHQWTFYQRVLRTLSGEKFPLQDLLLLLGEKIRLTGSSPGR